MGEIIVKKDTPSMCFARLPLENGDQIMIGVAQSGVKVSKMKWGIFPVHFGRLAARLRSRKSSLMSRSLFCTPRFDDYKLIDCRSAADMVVRLM
ncbi:hypothetical protein [Bradyrhizobium sp. WSM471]|uniref:hypothetical protein n=1 Tax=Bradyrhizobium sp. WSM471 TaxID=319017 RepID=UPI00024D1A99|nr:MULTISPECIES: hypothetical protein [Bradyrhizobium]EHQ99532.1 hypothetical protein Bra471DRAFT_00060 [Bradyrhizobium sp. WSM471]UFW41693.1 hypothetical protein BcanWSM471_00290 [Bradyrhizobium canariense]